MLMREALAKPSGSQGKIEKQNKTTLRWDGKLMSGVNEEGDKREQKDEYSQSALYKWMKCQNLICVFFSLNLIFEMIKFLPSLSSNSLHKLIPHLPSSS